MKKELTLIFIRLDSSRFLAADGSPDGAAAEKIILRPLAMTILRFAR